MSQISQLSKSALIWIYCVWQLWKFCVPIKTKQKQAKDIKTHHLHLVWHKDEGLLDASAVCCSGGKTLFAHQCYKHKLKTVTSTVSMTQVSGLKIGTDALDHTWGCYITMSHMCFCTVTPSSQMLGCCAVLHEVVMGNENPLMLWKFSTNDGFGPEMQLRRWQENTCEESESPQACWHLLTTIYHVYFCQNVLLFTEA